MPAASSSLKLQAKTCHAIPCPLGPHHFFLGCLSYAVWLLPATAAPSTILSLRRSVRHPVCTPHSRTVHPTPNSRRPEHQLSFLILQHHSLSSTIILRIFRYHCTLSPLPLPHPPFQGTQSIHTSRFSVSLPLPPPGAALYLESGDPQNSIARCRSIVKWSHAHRLLAERAVRVLGHLRFYTSTAVSFIAGGGAHSELWKSFHWTLQDTN